MNRFIDVEKKTDGCQIGGGWRGWMKKEMDQEVEMSDCKTVTGT